MEEKKYQVIKGRGIAFKDEKKVYTKGSEVGYSLKAIEQKLELKNQLQFKYENWREYKLHQYDETLSEKLRMQRLFPNRFISAPEFPERLIQEISKNLGKILEKLMRPEPFHQSLSNEFEQQLKKSEYERKKQRQRLSQGL